VRRVGRDDALAAWTGATIPFATAAGKYARCPNNAS
jgi:hypothetical protein